MPVESWVLVFVSVFVAVGLAALFGSLLLLSRSAARQSAELSQALALVRGQLQESALGLHARLDGTSGELSRTLAQGLQHATHTLTGSIGSIREETRARIDEKFNEVTSKLVDLQTTNERIMEFSQSLEEFQRILQTPKLRGDFGEFTLEQMLGELLPAEAYHCQATVAGGRADAVIHTLHGCLCVDSKFPLDNFRRALDATDLASKEAALKAFAGDVRRRVDEIAARFISPPETLEIAFMFVPAENVYYELLARPELVDYARRKRVIPVSPNTMYAYLHALAIGFRGLKIHQEARRVEQMLGELRTRFERFRDHFIKIGKHLDSAQTQFTGAQRDVDRFQATLDGLKVGRIDAVPIQATLPESEMADRVGLQAPDSPLQASDSPEPVDGLTGLTVDPERAERVERADFGLQLQDEEPESRGLDGGIPSSKPEARSL